MATPNPYQYRSFHTTQHDVLKEPMFLGTPVNVARYDQQKHVIFEKLTEKQLSFFWRPEEVDLSKDRVDYTRLSQAETHIFLANLKYQTLLDSVQGRSPNIALLPLVSLPELENWIETWSFSETIHSRSYTHMVRSLMENPAQVFDTIVSDHAIKNRAGDITRYYDDLIVKTQLLQSCGPGSYQLHNQTVTINSYAVKKALYLTLHAVNALEAIRFYVSFACTFAFTEQRKLEGCGKIMKLIARDEALHMTSTQHMINIINNGQDGDAELQAIAAECYPRARDIFLAAVQQEKQWAEYLFSQGGMLGLNSQLLCQYIDYIACERMQAIGITDSGLTPPSHHPIPWINAYLNSDNVQVAPQETEITSYLAGQINSDVNEQAFQAFQL